MNSVGAALLAQEKWGDLGVIHPAVSKTNGKKSYYLLLEHKQLIIGKGASGWHNYVVPLARHHRGWQAVFRLFRKTLKDLEAKGWTRQQIIDSLTGAAAKQTEYDEVDQPPTDVQP